MSWTKDDQTKLDILRGKELAGALTKPEHVELAALMARVEAEEAAALAPEMARLRAEVGEMARELGRLESENEKLDAYRKVMAGIQQVREYGVAQREEGKAEGKAAAVLAIFDARSIEVSATVRAHIEACKEATTLDRWIIKAVTATSADELIVLVPPKHS